MHGNVRLVDGGTLAMTQRTIYCTPLTVLVYTADKPYEFSDLSTLDYDTDEGAAVGHVEVGVARTLSAEEAEAAMAVAGSDMSFWDDDERGS